MIIVYKIRMKNKNWFIIITIFDKESMLFSIILLAISYAFVIIDVVAS